MQKNGHQIESDGSPKTPIFAKEAEASRKQVQRFLNDETIHWEHCKTAKGIRVDRFYPETSTKDHTGHAFRGQCLIPTDMNTVAYLIHPCAPYRIQWDSHLMDVEILEQTDENTVIVLHTVRPHWMGLIAARDSTDLVEFQKISPDIKEVYVTSVKYPKVPERKGFVRAWAYPGGARLERTSDPKVTKITSLMHAEINLPSIIPRGLSDMAMPSEIIQFLTKLQEAAVNIPVTERGNIPGWND